MADLLSFTQNLIAFDIFLHRKRNEIRKHDHTQTAVAHDWFNQSSWNNYGHAAKVTTNVPIYINDFLRCQLVHRKIVTYFSDKPRILVLGPKNALIPPIWWPVTKTAQVKDKIEKGTKSRITKKNKDIAIKFNLKPEVKNGSQKKGSVLLRNIAARSRNHLAVKEH